MSFLTNLFNAIQKDEQWVVTEIQKAWAEVQKDGVIVKADVEGVFNWIKAHQAELQAILSTALQGLALVGGVPELAPVIGIATTALDASEIAIDSLSKAAVGGPAATPLSTLVDTYHAVIDARTAVSSVLKTATSPTPTQTPHA